MYIYNEYLYVYNIRIHIYIYTISDIDICIHVFVINICINNQSITYNFVTDYGYEYTHK